MTIEETVEKFIAEVNAEFPEFGLQRDEDYGEEICIYVSHYSSHIYIKPDGTVDSDLQSPIVDKLRKALAPKPIPPAIRNSEPKRAVVPRDVPIRDVQVSDLTMDDIKGYICPSATDQEAFMFLKLCQARNLNPFTNEAYLIKYGSKATMVVGKEAFMRKAELHPMYKGFKAGTIIKGEDGDLIYREGSFIMTGEELVGGWAEVYRKDRNHPIRAEVALKDYDSGKDGPWKSHKATMIRKVPLVQAMREAFPNDLSGCYDSAEFRDSPEIIDAEMVEG